MAEVNGLKKCGVWRVMKCSKLPKKRQHSAWTICTLPKKEWYTTRKAKGEVHRPMMQ